MQSLWARTNLGSNSAQRNQHPSLCPDAGRKFVSSPASRAGSNPEHKKTSLAGGFFMARSAGFELTTFWSVVRCSIQLSYECIVSLNRRLNNPIQKILQAKNSFNFKVFLSIFRMLFFICRIYCALGSNFSHFFCESSLQNEILVSKTNML